MERCIVSRTTKARARIRAEASATAPTAAETTNANIAILYDGIIDRLVGAFPWHTELSKEMRVSGVGVTRKRTRELEAATKRLWDRFFWKSIAQASTTRMLRALFAGADSETLGRPAQFVDEDLRLIAQAFIAAPLHATRLGLDDELRHGVAAIVALYFSDRRLFVEPMTFVADGRTYVVRRVEHVLEVSLVKPQ